jgi:hypothetical protein
MYALGQCATASLAAAALAAVFIRRGLRTSTPSEPPGETAPADYLATPALGLCGSTER